MTQKQVETSCHEEKKSEGRKNSNSSKKGSYLQQRVAMHGKTSRLPSKNEEKVGESPVPRKQTPEPIRIGGKVEAPKPSQQSKKYAISKGGKGTHFHSNSTHTQPTHSIEESLLEPEKLMVKPYQENGNRGNVNSETIRSLE